MRKTTALLVAVALCTLMLVAAATTSYGLPRSGRIEVVTLPGPGVRAILAACKTFSSQSHVACDSNFIQAYKVSYSEMGESYYVTFLQRAAIEGTNVNYFYKINKVTFKVTRFFPL